MTSGAAEQPPESQPGAAGPDEPAPAEPQPDATGEVAVGEGTGREPADGPTGPGGQELGRVERPAAEQYRGRRRLLLAPLALLPPGDADDNESEGHTIYRRYWEQAETQIDALAVGLGGLHRIYHESLVEGGAAGLSYLQMAYRQGHDMIQAHCQAGAALEATESLELLTETLDLQRCLMLPFTNDQVAARLQEWLGESVRSRYQYIAARIDESLQPDETGLLLINERHQVQFPSDIEVFYIAPPALDEYRRWLQNWAARQERAGAEAVENGGEGDNQADESEAPAY